MAADSGCISIDQEIISIGGNVRGADTALVLMPVYSDCFLNLQIKEIICIPRVRRPIRE